jgi:hypothetical protein
MLKFNIEIIYIFISKRSYKNYEAVYIFCELNNHYAITKNKCIFEGSPDVGLPLTK